MGKKQPHKGAALSLRITEKMRYGLDLLARKRRVQMSSIVMMAIEKLLEDEALSSRESGQLMSLLDNLWSDSEAGRLNALSDFAPLLMTPSEKTELEILRAIDSCDGDLLEYLHEQVGLSEILAPGISDTFADDVLPGKHEYKNTLELKKAILERV